jgi:hypothetical protein
MGEGRSKMADVVAMPTIITVVTTRRKNMRVEGAPCHLCHCNHDNDSWSDYFGSDQTMLTSTFLRRPSRDKRIASQGRRGGDRKQLDVVVAISHRTIQAAKGDAEPPRLPLDPFCAFTTF